MADQLIRWMSAQNIPITRDAYLALAWGSGLPDPWTPEDEAELPGFLREENLHPDRRRRPRDR
jgi:hypothetical protein